MLVEQELRGNPEHTGISKIMPLILFGSIALFFAISYWLLPILFGGDEVEYIIIDGILAVVLGLLFLAFIDPVIKRLWPSGHTISLSQNRMLYQRPQEEPVDLFLDQPFKLTAWYFKMAGFSRYGRERQLKRGTYCCACQIQQEDERVVLFAYVAPTQINAMTADAPFVQLDMSEIFDTSLTGRMQQWRMPGDRPELPPGLVVSEKGRYWLGERNRWDTGVELTPSDFQTMLAHVLQFDKRNLQ